LSEAYGLKMADYLPPSAWNVALPPLKPGRGVLLWGEEVRQVAAAAAAWGAARGTPVWVVDAANRFDPYRMVREARARGLAPREALARVKVARAFTCHQLVRLLCESLPDPLEPSSLVLVLGPVSLFYDEQVPLGERRRLFKDLTRLLAAIKTRAALLLLQTLLPPGAPNRHFGRILAPMMDIIGVVEEAAGEGQAGATRRRPSPRSPSWQIMDLASVALARPQERNL
jgi:hypothetical protein